jgi:hypothetical protein
MTDGLCDDDVMNRMTPARANQEMASAYFARRHVIFAFTQKKAEETSPVDHNTKAVANGNAALWQGYVALLGFGITLTRNQINDMRPSRPKRSLLMATLGDLRRLDADVASSPVLSS